MSDTEEEVVEEYPVYNEKYEKMAVTPGELILRQQGKCWLELPFDNENGVLTPGTLMCTDGKDYAPTSGMLNPTFECVKCMSRFTTELAGDRMSKELKIHDFNRELLMAIGTLHDTSSLNLSPIKGNFRMSADTCDKVEVFFNSNTMSSKVTEPLRLDKEGEIRLFGIPIIIDASMEENVIEIQPTGAKVVFPDDKT